MHRQPRFEAACRILLKGQPNGRDQWQHSDDDWRPLGIPMFSVGIQKQIASFMRTVTEQGWLAVPFNGTIQIVFMDHVDQINFTLKEYHGTQEISQEDTPAGGQGGEDES